MQQEWTAEEIDILKKHYVNATKSEIKRLLPNRSWIAIRNCATSKLGLSRKTYVSVKDWTTEEEAFIHDKIATLSIQSLADCLNVSYTQMVYKIRKMNLRQEKVTDKEYWSAEEDEILKQHYEYAPMNYILEMLPNRDWNSILQHGSNVLGLERQAKDRLSCDYRFFDQWTEKSAYILGFVMADGYLALKEDGSTQNRLRIVVVAKDVDILYKIAAALKYRGNIAYLKHKNHDQIECNISFQNRWLLHQVKNKGIPVRNKSYTATFPDNIPDNMIRHFIRGIIDGDGFVSFYKRYNKIRGKHYDFLNIGWCGTLDIVTKIKDLLPFDCSNNTVTKNHSSADYYCHIGGKKAFQICEWLYKDATIFLDRKYDAYVNAKQKYAPSSEKSGEDTQ